MITKLKASKEEQTIDLSYANLQRCLFSAMQQEDTKPKNKTSERICINIQA